MGSKQPSLLTPYSDFPNVANGGILKIVVMGRYRFIDHPIFVDGKPIINPISIERVTNFLDRRGYPMTVIKIGGIKKGKHTISIGYQDEYEFEVK